MLVNSTVETPTISTSNYASTSDPCWVYGDQGLAIANAAFSYAKQKETPKMSEKRIVQVFICDPTEEVPLDKALLFRGDQKFTDLTDQELFFEVDIKTIIDSHNAFRATVLRKGSDKKFLDPIRIRDLKMVVVNVAGF